MKFQDSCLNGLKVTVSTKKCDPLTHACTHAPKAICPINFFKGRGIKRVYTSVCRGSTDSSSGRASDLIASSILTWGSVLCPSARHFIPIA